MPTASTNAEAKRALNQGKHKMKLLVNGLSVTSKHLSEMLADTLVDEINAEYNSFVSSPFIKNDHQDRSDTEIYKIKGYNGGYTVVATGSQVLYDEFGTGDAGLLDSHREKSKYNLNGYNTGAYIRLSPNGSHYWSFYAEHEGRYVSSQGVPAGMFMYHGIENVANNIAMNIELSKDEILAELIKLQER